MLTRMKSELKIIKSILIASAVSFLGLVLVSTDLFSGLAIRGRSINNYLIIFYVLVFLLAFTMFNAGWLRRVPQSFLLGAGGANGKRILIAAVIALAGPLILPVHEPGMFVYYPLGLGVFSAIGSLISSGLSDYMIILIAATWLIYTAISWLMITGVQYVRHKDDLR